MAESWTASRPLLARMLVLSSDCVRQWAQIPPADVSLRAILSAEELATYVRFRVAKRREEWLLGRVTAKRLVRATIQAQESLELSLADIAIQPAADGAPCIVMRAGGPRASEAWSLSISHRDGVAVCALSETGPVGVDIELVEPRSAGFIADYFTPHEIEQLPRESGSERDAMATATWSAKEAVLKACRLGLTVDTRALSCGFGGELVDDWCSFSVRWDPARVPHPLRSQTARPVRGRWRRYGRFVLAMAELGSADGLERGRGSGRGR